jgi:mono/diheme cytochrome c family protein
MRRSVKQRGSDIAVPELGDPLQLETGLHLYRRHCAQCHGAPGVAPEPFALGMMPTPAALVHAAREWPPAEIFWVIKEGIKMTGMPAWRYRMGDDEIWAVVAFVREMARLTPRQYAERAAGEAVEAGTADAGRKPEGTDALDPPPDAARGKRAIHQYACATCHAIPGIVGPNAPVGPPLDGVGSRLMLGGVLPNSSDNMVRWLRSPQAVAPLTAMPDLGLSERDARDIAAYLATLRRRP